MRKKSSLREFLTIVRGKKVIVAIFEAKMQIDIPFFDLDPMDVVWHGNYVKYTEIARCDLLNKLGYNYNNMREDGFAYPVATMDLKFIEPAYFMQEIVITTRLLEVEPCLLMKYFINDKKTGKKIFSAKTMQVCVDIATKESTYSAPKRLLEKIKELKNDPKD